MKLSLKIDASLEDERQAEVAKKALEAETEFQKRANTTLECSGEKLVFEAQSQDVASLRASANTFLRLLSVALQADNSTKR